MSDIIGPASDFYRLRLIRIDEGGDVEFDWREDVLWRDTPAKPATESDTWVLQAVTLDVLEHVTVVASFTGREDAEAALEESQVDLGTMTKSEFEAEYLRESRPEDESDSF